MDKTITISEKLWEYLTQAKLNNRSSTIEDVIWKFIKEDGSEEINKTISE